MQFVHLLVSFALLTLPIVGQQPHLTDYDEAEARILVNLAAGAYSNMPETCINNTMPPSQHWYIVNEENTVCDAQENSCAGYTVRSDVMRQYIVVFRGTKTKKQLLLEGWKSLEPGIDFLGVGKVNRYFFHALGTIWPSIEALLKDPDFRSYTVTFTGHSLGGALASLAAMRAILDELRNSDEVKLITFGQPRVGDRDFAMKHDQLVPHSYRIVHRADIVPHLPACRKSEDDPETEDDKSKPCDMSSDGKAYHHGTEIWYPYGMKEGAQYFECLGPPKNEDFNCSDGLTFDMSEYEVYISDHRHYFDHRVPTYGKLGCVEVTEKEEVALKESAGSLGEALSSKSKLKSAVEKIISSVSKIAHLVGLDRK